MDEEPISSWVETDQRIYVGYKNGKVRAYHLEEDTYTEEILREGLENHHTIEMHDCQSGDVISLATSVDGRFLVSCGNDGNIFSYEVTLPKDTNLVEMAIPVVDGQHKGQIHEP